MDLIIETGVGDPDAQSYATVEDARAYANGRWGLEAISDEGECDDQTVAKALWAAAEYMNKISWYGVPANDVQALAWPRILVEPHTFSGYDHTSPIPTTGWFSTHSRYYHSRWCVPPNVVPKEIVQANILLAKDIIEGDLDPRGLHKPVIATSASAENGSISFAKPQALANKGGMRVRSKDPLYAIRDLVRQWIYIHVPSVTLKRG